MRGGGGVVGSQTMSTAVHRSPNKPGRSNSIFNLWLQYLHVQLPPIRHNAWLLLLVQCVGRVWIWPTVCVWRADQQTIPNTRIWTRSSLVPDSDMSQAWKDIIHTVKGHISKRSKDVPDVYCEGALPVTEKSFFKWYNGTYRFPPPPPQWNRYFGAKLVHAVYHAYWRVV